MNSPQSVMLLDSPQAYTGRPHPALSFVKKVGSPAGLQLFISSQIRLQPQEQKHQSGLLSLPRVLNQQNRFKKKKKSPTGSGEMAQQLRAFAILPAVQFPEPVSGLIPRTRITTICHASSRSSDILFWLLQAAGMHVMHRYTCSQSTHTYKVKIKGENMALFHTQR